MVRHTNSSSPERHWPTKVYFYYCNLLTKLNFSTQPVQLTGVEVSRQEMAIYIFILARNDEYRCKKDKWSLRNISNVWCTRRRTPNQPVSITAIDTLLLCDKICKIALAMKSQYSFSGECFDFVYLTKNYTSIARQCLPCFWEEIGFLLRFEFSHSPCSFPNV